MASGEVARGYTIGDSLPAKERELFDHEHAPLVHRALSLPPTSLLPV